MADKLTREDRLAQALRDNLRRRKAQARAALDPNPDTAPEPPREEPCR